MTLRNILWIALRTAAGVCALFVSLHGVWNLYGLDFRIDTIVSALYCLLPFLSFFIFLFARKPQRELILQVIIVFGYLMVYSMLNWRTCSGFGDCISVPSTVFETLQTKAVLAAFAVLVLSAVGLFFDAAPAAKSV